MFKIGIAQIEIIPANPRHNKETILHFIKEAESQNTNLLIFPELSISGYLIGDLWDQPAFVRECTKMGEEIIRSTSSMTVIFGNVGVDEALQNTDGRLRKYNALFAARNGKLLPVKNSPYQFYVKTLAPNYRFFNEARYFTSLMTLACEKNCPVSELLGTITVPYKTETIEIAPLICEDSWTDNYPLNPTLLLQEKENPGLYVNISNSPFTLGKNERRTKLFASQMQSISAPLLYVNATGLQNNGKSLCTFDGASAAYNPDGSYTDLFNPYEAGLSYMYFDADTNRLTALPPSECTAQTASNLIQSSASEPISDEYEQIYNALTYGIKKMTARHHIEKILIGVSGGIDSALNAALYTSVLGPDNVYLLTMPSRFNSDETQTMAKELAAALQCPFASFPIEASYTLSIEELNNLTFTKKDGTSIPIELTGLGKENIQARDRSARILSAVASSLGAVFTCNGNKTELSVGYATLYGDLAGFLAATADLWKYQMYGLAQYMNTVIFKQQVIPQASLEVVPSAELSAAQDVTKGLGDPMQYEYHDRLFRAFIEPWNRLSPEDILRAYKNGTLESVLELPQPISTYFTDTASFITDLERWWNLQAGFAVAKRIQSPPIITVSRRSYGGDLQESQLIPYYTDAYYSLKKELL